MNQDPAKPSPAEPELSILAYEVALCVEPLSDTIGVVADIFIEAHVPLDQLFFDATDLRVARIVANGQSRPQISQLTTLPGTLIASFAVPLAPGMYRVLAELQAPLRSDGRGLHKDHAMTLALTDPTHLWPLLRAAGRPTIQLRVIAPAGLDVATDTAVISSLLIKGHRHTTFAPTSPMDPSELTLTVAHPVLAASK